MWTEEVDGVPAVLRALGLERGTDYRLNESRLEVSFANGSTVHTAVSPRSLSGPTSNERDAAAQYDEPNNGGTF